jgi:L-malate glycosyltransferase
MRAQNRRIKILFLIDELIPGGTEKQLISLVSQLVKDDFDPVIGVFHTTDYERQLRTGIRIMNFRWSGLPLVKNIVLLWRLWRYLTEQAFDIVQTHFIEATLYGAWAVKLCKKKPYLITTRRNLYHWISDARWRFTLYRLTTRWTDKVLVNSYSVLEKCQEIERIPLDKIALINNGVDIDQFGKVSPDVAKRQIGLSDRQLLVGVVGNLRPVKGLRVLLESAAIVSQQVSNIHFVLVGHGPQEQELRSFAHELGIKERVSFILDCLHVAPIVAAFDIAVLPSLSESFSNALLEYMAAAKPIVATKVGDAERILEHGRDGLLVPPSDPKELAAAILLLSGDHRRAEEMGRLAREKVESNWTLSTMLIRYTRFYGEIARAGRTTAKESNHLPLY